MYTALLQFSAQITVVVNFTVEDYYIATIQGAHRLMASWREIEDGQTAETKGNASSGIYPYSYVIWATMD
jgi:hypothetical protein